MNENNVLPAHALRDNWPAISPPTCDQCGQKKCKKPFMTTADLNRLYYMSQLDIYKYIPRQDAQTNSFLTKVEIGLIFVVPKVKRVGPGGQENPNRFLNVRNQEFYCFSIIIRFYD